MFRAAGRLISGPILTCLLLAGHLVACAAEEPKLSPPPEPTEDLRPNVLLLSIDTLRADHLSTYGYERKTAPRLDSFSGQGVVFEQAYSHSPKTAPSHMSLMTSLYPEAHGVRQLSHDDSRRLADGIPTLALLLQRAGYRSAAITSGGNVSAELGFDRGIHSYQIIHDVEILMQSAAVQMQAMQSVKPEREPLFVFLHTYEVHDPYMPDEPYRDLFTDPNYGGRIPATMAKVDGTADEIFQKTHGDYWGRVDKGDPLDVAHLRNLYDGSIRHVDTEFAKLLGWMRETRRLNDTLVIVLSDHGEEFGDHGQFLHARLYQEHLHVPLIMVFPAKDRARFAGKRIDDPVRLIDVAPTILDYLSIPIPEGMQGESLMPLLTGKGPGPPPTVMSSYARRGHLALRDGRFKLVEQRKPRRDGSGFRWEQELYDVVADPDETQNLATAVPDVALQLSMKARELDAEAKVRWGSTQPGQKTRPDKETVDSLRALGYVE